MCYYPHMFGCGFLMVSCDGGGVFQHVGDMHGVHRHRVKKNEEKLKRMGVLQGGERITGVYEESSLLDEVDQLALAMVKEEVKNANCLEVYSCGLYFEIANFAKQMELEQEAQVCTKYKTVGRKVKPVATQLPDDTMEKIQSATTEPMLREARKIGHQFSEETLKQLRIGGGDFLTDLEKEKFRGMLAQHGKLLLLIQRRLVV
ncbi:unnamed protein product [Calypogeia fissa]